LMEGRETTSSMPARNSRPIQACAWQKSSRDLRATVLRPFYPASDLLRLARQADGLQIDFMSAIHGLRSFEGVRDRAVSIDIGGVPIRVAALADIIRSKRAAGRRRPLPIARAPQARDRACRCRANDGAQRLQEHREQIAHVAVIVKDQHIELGE